MSARYIPQTGPAMRWASSSTRYPDRGRVVIAPRMLTVVHRRRPCRGFVAEDAWSQRRVDSGGKRASFSAGRPRFKAASTAETDEEPSVMTSKTPVMDALVDFVLGLELATVPPAVV